MVVVVRVCMVVGMRVVVGGAGADEQPDANGGEEQAAAQAEPGIDALGGDRPGGREDQPEEQDPGGVGERDRGPDGGRLPQRAAQADQVGRHHRLAMPGGQRMRRPQEHGQQHRHQPKPGRE
jgi:hypothetical protein